MLNIFTLVLDGMPWITGHINVLNRLRVPWQWVIVEGAALNNHCTYWCKPQEHRTSRDGTSQYLDHLAAQHPRVQLLRQPVWDGKVSMCNAALARLTEPGILLQLDSDEIWTSDQLEKLVAMFNAHNITHANFYCNFFMGPNIVTTDNNGDWVRAWRYKPGQKFTSHEPPVLDGQRHCMMDRTDTKNAGLVFDHMSYVLEPQVQYKQEFYGYANAVEQWKKFQLNKNWPVTRQRDHLTFAGERATADLYVR